MGSVISTCCGLREKKARTGEREPLLPQHRDRDETVDAVVPDQQSLNKIADLIAAVGNGKLPSQDQLNNLIRRILQSQIFKEINKDKHDTLSRRGQVVLKDLEEVLRAFMDLGMEKNGEARETSFRVDLLAGLIRVPPADDDKVQDIVDELRHVRSNPVSVDTDFSLNTSAKDAAGNVLHSSPNETPPVH